MSTEPHSWCASQNKRGYGSKSAARTAHSKSGERLRYYRCPECRAWHAASGIGRGSGLPREPPKRRPRGNRRPAKTPKDPKLHKFLPLPGEPSLCFVCGEAREPHEN